MAERTTEHRPPVGTLVQVNREEFSADAEMATKELKELMQVPGFMTHRFFSVEVTGGVFVATRSPRAGVYYTEKTEYDGSGTRKLSAIDYHIDPNGKVEIVYHDRTIQRPFTMDLLKIGEQSGLGKELKLNPKPGLPEDMFHQMHLAAYRPYGIGAEVVIDEAKGPILRYKEVMPQPFINSGDSIRFTSRLARDKDLGPEHFFRS